MYASFALAFTVLPLHAQAPDCGNWTNKEFIGATTERAVPQAQVPDCANWASKEFFQAATKDDVSRCFQNGWLVEPKSDHGLKPLHYAARYSTNPDVIKKLIDAGAEPNSATSDGLTPLHFAGAGAGIGIAKLPVIEALIKALNDRKEDVNSTDKFGLTALHFAGAANADLPVIEALICYGESPVQMNSDGLTPLHVAARYSTHSSVIEKLIEEGASPNSQDNEGWTPLHWAAVGNANPDVIFVLHQKGAQLMEDRYGRTPLEIAVVRGNSHVFQEYWDFDEYWESISVFGQLEQ